MSKEESLIFSKNKLLKELIMSNLKTQAKKLSQVSKKYGYNIKHTHALEIISQIEGDSSRHVKIKKEKIGPNLLSRDFQRGLFKVLLTNKEHLFSTAVLADQAYGSVKKCFDKDLYKIFLAAKKCFKKTPESKLSELKKILSSNKKNEVLAKELDVVLSQEINDDTAYTQFFYTFSLNIMSLKNINK